jgi:hypothetical protein
VTTDSSHQHSRPMQQLGVENGEPASLPEGTPVEVDAGQRSIDTETIADLPLEQMLQRFDPQRHGGESMADRLVGVEKID